LSYAPLRDGILGAACAEPKISIPFRVKMSPSRA